MIDDLILHWLRKLLWLFTTAFHTLQKEKLDECDWLQFFRGQSAYHLLHTQSWRMFQQHGQSMAFELSVAHGLLFMLVPSAEPVIPPSLSKSQVQHPACDTMIYLSTGFSSPLECQLFRSQDCILFSVCFHSAWYNLLKWIRSINVW